MNHTECGRCGAEFGGITPLLEHYQEEHRGVPKAWFRVENTGEELLKKLRALVESEEGMCDTSSATHTSRWSEPVPSSTIPNRPLSTPGCVCSNSLQQAERGLLRGMD
jgi:hypothetical protein